MNDHIETPWILIFESRYLRGMERRPLREMVEFGTETLNLLAVMNQYYAETQKCNAFWRN